jgi:hypothetical protein
VQELILKDEADRHFSDTCSEENMIKKAGKKLMVLF